MSDISTNLCMVMVPSFTNINIIIDWFLILHFGKLYRRNRRRVQTDNQTEAYEEPRITSKPATATPPASESAQKR